MASISSLSVEYIKVEVIFIVSGVVTDPTSDAVALAFKTPGTDPLVGDWVAGTWESDVTVASRPIRYARCLVGTGGKVLAKGDYTVWVKVTDNPETPIMAAGLLEVQ